MQTDTGSHSGWDLHERDFPSTRPLWERLRFLIRYAILAPSSHNTQPWRFSVAGDWVDVFADTSRWLKVADPQQRELFLSIGCAIENLLIAAEYFGMAHEVTYFPESNTAEHVARIVLSEGGEPSFFRPPDLFSMLIVRRTSHGAYEPRSIPADVLHSLEKCCVETDVCLHLTTDPNMRQAMDALLSLGDAELFADPEYRAELAQWIGAGSFGTSWLMSKIGQLAVRQIDFGRSLAKSDSAKIRSSPLIGVLSSREDDPLSQVHAGQVFERMALLASSQTIRVQPVSNVVEVPRLRKELAKLLPTPNLIPQHPFRMGYAKLLERHTPRRPLTDVLD